MLQHLIKTSAGNPGYSTEKAMVNPDEVQKSFVLSKPLSEGD